MPAGVDPHSGRECRKGRNRSRRGRGGGKYRYVTYRYLEGKNYVTYPALNARDYLPQADLTAPLPAHPTLPTRLDARLIELEVSVLNPGRNIHQLQARLRDLNSYPAICAYMRTQKPKTNRLWFCQHLNSSVGYHERNKASDTSFESYWDTLLF